MLAANAKSTATGALDIFPVRQSFLSTNLDSRPDPAISIPVRASQRPVTIWSRGWSGQHPTQYSAYKSARAETVVMMVMMMVVMVMVMVVEPGRNQAWPRLRLCHVINPELLQRIWYGRQEFSIGLDLRAVDAVLVCQRCSLRRPK